MTQYWDHPPIGKCHTREFRDMDTRRDAAAGELWWWYTNPTPVTDDEAPPSADPILAAIADQLQAMQRPGIPDAALHAQRLRKMAEWPGFDATLAEWMVELAGHVEAAG